MTNTTVDTLRYKRQDPIEVPAQEKEARRAIRKADWNRIKRLVERIPSESDILRIIYSILFGVAGSVGLSIYPIYSNPQASSWLFPLYVCITVFSLLVAFVFCVLDRRIRKSKINYLQMIQKDMEEIESIFEIESGTDETTSSKKELTHPTQPSTSQQHSNRIY